MRVHGSRNPAHPLGAFRYFPLRPLARISQFTPIISHLGPFRCGVQPPATRHSFPAWSNLTLTPIPELRCARTRKGPLCRSGGWGGEQHTGLKRPRCSPNPTFRFWPNATARQRPCPTVAERSPTSQRPSCGALHGAWHGAAHVGRERGISAGASSSCAVPCSTPPRVWLAQQVACVLRHACPCFGTGPAHVPTIGPSPPANYAAQTLQNDENHPPKRRTFAQLAFSRSAASFGTNIGGELLCP